MILKNNISVGIVGKSAWADMWENVYQNDPELDKLGINTSDFTNYVTLDVLSDTTDFLFAIPDSPIYSIPKNVSCFGPNWELVQLEHSRHLMRDYFPGVQMPKQLFLGNLEGLRKAGLSQGVCKIIWGDLKDWIGEEDCELYSQKFLTYVFKSKEELGWFIGTLQNHPAAEKILILVEELIPFKFEVSIGGFFSCGEFIKPYHLWYEYKRPYNGNLGPNDVEAGVVLETTNENHFLYKELKRIELALQRIEFNGYFDANFLITKDNQSILVDIDARFPFPGQAALCTHPNFLEHCFLIAKGSHVGSIDYQLPKWTVCGTTWLHKHHLGCQLRVNEDEPIESVKPFMGMPLWGLLDLIRDYSAMAQDSRYNEYYREFSMPNHIMDWGDGAPAAVVGKSEFLLSEARANYKANAKRIRNDFLVYRTDIGEGL